VSTNSVETIDPAHFVDDRAAVFSVPTEELDVAGLAVAGDRRQVDKVFDKLEFHP
jgi:hypothetical protein